jgi:hypothetical protein
MGDLNRIFVGWPGGYFVTSLHNSEFHRDLQEMVTDLGPPTTVEYRASDKGWHDSDGNEVGVIDEDAAGMI